MDSREVRDLLAAWLALGAAFTLFFGGGQRALQSDALPTLVVASFLTAGLGFLAHELAHKVVAQRFGQVARFRADYGMLAFAVLSGLAGFLFAAPGAVQHAGRITKRQHGLIALAGPAANVALVVAFAPLLLVGGPVSAVGGLGVLVNAFLAGFNMIPFGPLDGRTVLDWSYAVFAGAFALCAGLAVVALVSGLPTP